MEPSSTEYTRGMTKVEKDFMQLHSQLAQDQFEKYVLEVTIKTLENGGTVSKIDTYQLLPPADDWKFPKYPNKTAILPPEVDLVEELKKFILANEPFLREPDCSLGTWIHPQTHCFYLDIATSVSDLAEARKMALEIGDREGRKIVALYNSERNEIVYL